MRVYVADFVLRGAAAKLENIVEKTGLPVKINDRHHTEFGVAYCIQHSKDEGWKRFRVEFEEKEERDEIVKRLHEITPAIFLDEYIRHPLPQQFLQPTYARM